MSDDLISRTAALDIINAELNGWLTEDERLHLEGVGMGIESLPTAQPEIIRCRDCKWYDITHPYGTVIPDAYHCKANDRFYEGSHFCAYGERRDDVRNP